MTITTTQTSEILAGLLDKDLTVFDGNTEYIIEKVIKRKVDGDDDLEWYYSLKVRPAEGECLLR